jgi:chemotaxis protein MotB
MAVASGAVETAKSGRKKPKGAPVWLVTFADLMALLFALSVLIISFSKIDSDSFRRNAGPMAEAFNQPPPIFTRSEESASSASKPVQPKLERENEAPSESEVNYLRTVQRGKLTEQVRSALDDELRAGVVELDIKDRFIILRFPARTTFALGNSDLVGAIGGTLDRIADVLARTNGEIFISGQTDSRPISTSRFRPNWDLSSARAVSVVHRLLRHPNLNRGHISAVGYADTRSISDNDTADGRAENRRVEIKVEIPASR